MPVLSAPSVTEITLPVSGAKVSLSITYGEAASVQAVLFEGNDDPENIKLSGERLTSFQRRACEATIKSWDFTEEEGAAIPVSWDAIQRLHPEDGTALTSACVSLVSPKIDAPKGGKSRTS
jgi:hypothetical protein